MKCIGNANNLKKEKRNRKGNKRSMGHIAHLRTVQLNKTYDYIKTLIKIRKKTQNKLNENLLVFHLNKLESLHPTMLCVKFGWNWPSVSGEEDFLISSVYFRYFVIFSPWKRVEPFIWTNLNSLHPRMLWAKFCWNWLSGSGEEEFQISSMFFVYFIIISPWKRAGAFI